MARQTHSKSGNSKVNRRQTAGIYKVRSLNNGSAFGIGLPATLGEKVEGRSFRVEVTDEGILLRPMAETDSVSFETDYDNAAWA